MDWWVPLAIVGAIVGGVGFALALAAPRRAAGLANPPRPAGPGGTRYQRDNAVSWNPVAFLVVLGLVGGITALAVVLAVT
jgi:hypothetical protein